MLYGSMIGTIQRHIGAPKLPAVLDQTVIQLVLTAARGTGTVVSAKYLLF